MFRYYFGMSNMGGNNKASITWIIFDYYYYSRAPLPFQATELVFSYDFCKDGCHLLIGLSFGNKISHLNCNWAEIALHFCNNDSYLWHAMNFKSISLYKHYFNFCDLSNGTFRIKDFIVRYIFYCNLPEIFGNPKLRYQPEQFCFKLPCVTIATLCIGLSNRWLKGKSVTL